MGEEVRRRGRSGRVSRVTPVDAAPTSLRWVGLGVTTIGVLTLVDVAGSLLTDDGQYANIAGTLAMPRP